MATKPKKWTVPRETVEWIGPVTFTPSDATLKLAILPDGQRPAAGDWLDPVTLDGGVGLMFDPPAEGQYYYWAKLTDNPETPVIESFASIFVT